MTLAELNTFAFVSDDAFTRSMHHKVGISDIFSVAFSNVPLMWSDRDVTRMRVYASSAWSIPQMSTSHYGHAIAYVHTCQAKTLGTIVTWIQQFSVSAAATKLSPLMRPIDIMHLTERHNTSVYRMISLHGNVCLQPLAAVEDYPKSPPIE